MTSAARRESDAGCICRGNWRAIIREYEPFFGKRVRAHDGTEYTFWGIVHADDDYYYGLSAGSGFVLSSCVFGLFDNYDLIEPPKESTT